MSTGLKRSNAPVFWLLFGAGGMLSALAGPVLVLITGIVVPSGLVLSQDTLSYQNMLRFAQSWEGKAFWFLIVVLFLWHAGHRILHSLHDLGVHVGIGVKLVCYGLPLLATLVTGYALLTIGFS